MQQKEQQKYVNTKQNMNVIIVRVLCIVFCWNYNPGIAILKLYE